MCIDTKYTSTSIGVYAFVCVCVREGGKGKGAFFRRSRISPPTATFRLNT